MNERQRIAMWIGIGLFAALGIFPPWYYVHREPSELMQFTPAGHALIFAPPIPPPSSWWDGVEIDLVRLFTGWVMIVSLTANAVLCLKERKPRRPPSASASRSASDTATAAP